MSHNASSRTRRKPRRLDAGDLTTRLYLAVHEERLRAHAKHLKDSMEQKPWDHPVWLPVLTEEVGEVARVLCERELGNEPATPKRLREELVQVAAMACAWIAALDEREHHDG